MNIESINIGALGVAAIVTTNSAYNLVIQSYNRQEMVSACFNDLNTLYNVIETTKQRCFEYSKTEAIPEVFLHISDILEKIGLSYEQKAKSCQNYVNTLLKCADRDSVRCQRFASEFSESDASLYLPVALATGLTLLTAYLVYKKFLATR